MRIERTPDDFRVAACMMVHNEADCIEHGIRAALAQGVDVYVWDNYSTDDTWAIAQSFLGHGVVGLARWGRAGNYRYLEFLDWLGSAFPVIASDYAWVLKWEPDERIYSPFAGQTYRDCLYHADCLGYNVINHFYLDFLLYDGFDGVPDGEDPEPLFTRFEQRVIDDPSGGVLPFPLQRAWKTQRVRVTAGGHGLEFSGRAVSPQYAILKHYRYRNRAQQQQKNAARLKRRAVEIEAGVAGMHYVNRAAAGGDVAPRELREWRESDWIRPL